MQSNDLLHIFEQKGLPAYYKGQSEEAAFTNPEFRQLDYLIKVCKAKTKAQKNGKIRIVHNEELDTLLMDLFGDNFSRKQARFFLTQLYINPAFTEKVLRNLRITAYPFKQLTEEADIASTEEIFAAIRMQTPAKQNKKLAFADFDMWGNIRPVPAYFSVGIAVLLIIAIFWPNHPAEKMYKKYLENPGAVYTGSSQLRGSSLTENSYDYSSIETDSEWGITFYNDQDFSKAIDKFNNIIKNYENELAQNLALAHKIYFYRGLSYLALSNGLPESPLLTKAVESLETALQYEDATDQNNSLLFFIGMGYFFKGNMNQAVTYLEKIPQESQYFADAKYLIKQCQ